MSQAFPVTELPVGWTARSLSPVVRKFLFVAFQSPLKVFDPVVQTYRAQEETLFHGVKALMG